MRFPFPARYPRLARLAILALVVLAAGGIWLALRADSGDAAQLYVTAKAVRGDIEDTTTALGVLQPHNYVDVGTQVSGQLRKIHVELGDRVVEGQLLAEIDPTVYQTRVDSGRAQLLNLRAQLAEKEANHALAREQFDRQSRMIKANATSQDAFQSSVAALKTAQAQIAQLGAQIQQIESTLRGDEANLGYTKILAPLAGTVVTQPARQGQTLNASQQAPTIVRIADLATMTVWTQVSEADVGRLRLGMEAYFSILGQTERRWTGTLRQVLPTPEIINNVVLYNALFDVANPTGELGIQMSAQVFFVHSAARDATLVPAAALAMGGRDGKSAKGRVGGESVLVVRDGKATPRAVVTGVRNRVQVQIVSGLEPGEEVAVGLRQTQAKPPGATPRPRI